jgi:hypothetical protein
MKKVLVFENTEYNSALEKELYSFCAKQQKSLYKRLFIYFWYSFLYFFWLIPKKKYYEKRLGFLKDVTNLDDKVNSFWSAKKKQVKHVVSDGEIIWISEYPDILLKGLAQQCNAQLIANEYNVSAASFSSFESITDLYQKISSDEKIEIYDRYNSKLKNAENADFIIVDNHKAFTDYKAFRTHKIKDISFITLLLLALGFGIGCISLYFGASHYRIMMFLCYFLMPIIPFLNILPVILCILLLYFISNRVWISFVATSVLVIVLSFINYFKLMFRNDPLLYQDLSLFSESMDMTGKYNIQLSFKMIFVIIAGVVITLALGFFVKRKIRSLKIRLIGIVAVVALGICSFNGMYMNDTLYNSIQNFNRINSRWSSTDVYISKGFLYPFIYSYKASIDNPPAGYNEKKAKKTLYSYKYSNIPKNKKVNVIQIMMESYNDLSKFKQIKFNVDVYKYLHELEKESYSGELVTNIFGGGTVSTERSFFTGLTALPNFRSNVNSYVRYFGEQGYTVEGSHPCYDWFYNRLNIDQYLGFPKYYFFENYYGKLANNQIARDNILFPQIVKLFNENKKTGKPYFSGNVTYQNHGPYKTEKLTNVNYIQNMGLSTEDYNILNNYFSGIYDTTQRIKWLIDTMKKEKEPVVVILFGDHNPELGTNNDIYQKLKVNFNFNTADGFYNYYDTPYVIWANDSAKKTLGNQFVEKGPKIGPYFLMNEFFKLAGYKGNEFMKMSNELRQKLPVVHVTGRKQEKGVMTWKVSPDAQKTLDKFLKVQYYWRKNFRKNGKDK